MEAIAERTENVENGPAPACEIADQEMPEPTSCDGQTDNLPQHAVTVPACDHTYEIRNEAVRLAAIACGRALRRAVLLHPQVIAAFVDDAIASSGGRPIRRILVHESLVPHLGQHRGSVQAATDLCEGDIEIELEGGSIGAGLKRRAELLVAAAAER